MSALDEPENGQVAESENAHAVGEAGGQSGARSFARNSLLSIARLLFSSIVALALPGYLTHKLPVKTYAAWILILQVSSFVNYLDFGVQSGISKYVAEFEAKNDRRASSMRASAGLGLMVIASVLGVLLTVLLAWRTPQLFHDMPSSLYRDVRISILFVGLSLSFSLLCSVFSSIFLGLQRFAVPMILSMINRLLFAGAVLIAVALHQSLAVMGFWVAMTNVIGGIFQFEAWRRCASAIRLSLASLDMRIVWKMLSYCSSLAIWTAGMLCVSGLDITIVGRYDYGETAFYSIATLPTGFIIAMMGATLAPLMPAASALSVQRTAVQMGNVLSKMTRYGSTLLIVSALPLIVAGYWILTVWVGPVYASHSVKYLRILIIANVFRSMCVPYANMLVATDSQRIAVIGVIIEAIVNLSCSVYLARHLGAIGVAYGTLIGSFVSVGMHFLVNMYFTQGKIAIVRSRLFLSGIARPCLIVLPSILLIPYWWSSSSPQLTAEVWLSLAICSATLAWFAAFDAKERRGLLGFVRRRFSVSPT